MLLHTLNKPQALRLCRDLISSDDVIVLIEDGVYLASGDLPCRAFAIDIDLAARGIGPGSAEVINHSRFVELCTQADRVCAWF